jgi:hypothetical protein
MEDMVISFPDYESFFSTAERLNWFLEKRGLKYFYDEEDDMKFYNEKHEEFSAEEVFMQFIKE